LSPRNGDKLYHVAEGQSISEAVEKIVKQIQFAGEKQRGIQVRPARCFLLAFQLCDSRRADLALMMAGAKISILSLGFL
jgi:hypothetical protein